MASLGILWLASLVQALVVVRVETIRRRMNHSISKSFSWVTVRFDLTVFAFKINIIEDNVAARDSVAARKFDGFLTFGCPGYVPVHYLADFNRRGLHLYQTKKENITKFSSLSFVLMEWSQSRAVVLLYCKETWFWHVVGESQ